MGFDEVAIGLLEKARANAVTIATAESCTGGLIAAALTEIPGSSDVFERGFVTYSNSAKVEMLDVSQDALASYGAVSEIVALEMAEGALRRAQVSLSVSVTGIAGPGGSEFKPEGRVCFGLARTGVKTHTESVEFGAIGRFNVRKSATLHALKLLESAL